MDSRKQSKVEASAQVPENERGGVPDPEEDRNEISFINDFTKKIR